MADWQQGFTVLSQNLWYTNSRCGWDVTGDKERQNSGDDTLLSNWKDRCAAFRRWIQFLQPDVICLQEVLQGEGYDMVFDIFGLESDPFLNYSHRVFSKASDWWGKPHVAFGNAVVSKHPIKESFTLSLPQQVTAGDPYVETRSAVTCLIETSFGIVSVTSTHLNYKLHHSLIRVDQVAALSAFVNKHRPKGKDSFPAIIAGDFNATPNELCIRYLRGEAYLDKECIARIPADLIEHSSPTCFWVDSWATSGNSDNAGHTWSHYNPNTHVDLEESKRLDYIFATRPNRDGVGFVDECRVVCDHPFAGTLPSDHFGVFAEFRAHPSTKPRRDSSRARL